ncbi:MAG: LytTR family DNA-binding domain-containing protein [Candidatus Cryptobacteroides sp.]
MSKFRDAMNRSVPRNLRLGRFPYTSVWYTLFFAAIFLVIYNPFSSSVWFSLYDSSVALETILFFALALITMFISKAIWLQFCRRHRARNWIYLLWIAGECTVIALEYIALTFLLSLGAYESVGSMILKTIFCVVSILVIPHTLLYITSSYVQVREEMDLLKSENDRTPTRDDISRMSQRMMNFTDDSGVLRFSVDMDSILYIKSEGNYVNLFYEKGDGVSSHLMRMTISSLETKISGTPLVRCQRSYIVNARRIRMMQNDGRGAYVILDSDSCPVIPLSQNYASSLADVVLKLRKA